MTVFYLTGCYVCYSFASFDKLLSYGTLCLADKYISNYIWPDLIICIYVNLVYADKYSENSENRAFCTCSIFGTTRLADEVVLNVFNEFYRFQCAQDPTKKIFEKARLTLW